MSLPDIFPPRPPTPRELKRNLSELKDLALRRPLDLDVRLRIARTYRLLGKPKDAIAHYRSVTRYLALAGHPFLAIAVAKELLQVDPSHTETLLFLAKLYARTRGATESVEGRVATPVAPPAPAAGKGGAELGTWPRTTSGLWRAIRPVQEGEIGQLLARPDPHGGRRPRTLPPPVPREEGDPPQPPLPSEADTLPPPAADGPPPPVPGGPEETPAPAGADRLAEAAAALAADDAVLAAEAEEVLELGDDAIEEEEILQAGGEGLAHLPANAEDGVRIPADMAAAPELPTIPLFSTLDRDMFVRLSTALVARTAKAGQVVWKEGEDAPFLAIVASGHALAYRGEETARVDLARLGPGDFAGVFALLSERKRQASLQAETDLSYFELHRNVVEEAAREDSGLSQALQAFFRERVTVTALAMLPGFRDMEPGVRAVLAQTFRTKQYEDGAELFYEGAEICGLWLVLEGNVQVGCESTSGEVQPLRTLPPGHFLGTLAALEHAQTDGAAVAQGVVTTVTLWHRALVDLARQHPSLLKLRSQVAEEGLAITTHIWGGSAQLPTNLSPGFVQGDPRY